MKRTHKAIRLPNCERCGESLNKPKWLELSLTDGYFYAVLPKNHESQGAFSFGVQCATVELNKTIEYLKGKM